MAKNVLSTKICILILILNFLNGCTTYSSNTWWSNSIKNNSKSSESLNKKSIAVLFFQDARDNSKDYNDLLLIIFPFAHSWTQLSSYPFLRNYPENREPLTIMPYLQWYFNYADWHVPSLDLKSHFGTALYIETNNSRLFNRVMLAPNDKNLDSDYYIQGTILNTSVLRELKTYRLGWHLSALLKLTGLPHEEDTYIMKLNLKILNKNKDVIFDRIYWAKPRKIVSTVYKNHTLAYRLMIFNEMIEEIYTQFFKDIKDTKF